MKFVLVGAALLAIVLLRVLAVRRARAQRERLVDRRLFSLLAREPSRAGTLSRALALALGVAALGLALLGGGRSDSERSDPAGLETVLVLDASNSMLADDIEPNRLTHQQAAARELIMGLPGRLGVVYFAGRGYVLSPLTTDRDAAIMYAESVHPSVVGRGGSAVAGGLRQALQVLDGGEDDTRKVILLLSDGESTEGEDNELLQVVQEAAEAGIEIHALGIGTSRGGRISASSAIGVGGRRAGPPGTYLRGPDGEIVVSRLEEGALKLAAEETGGSYDEADDSGVSRMIARLNLLAASDDDPDRAGAANLLLVLAFLLLWIDGFAARRS